MSKASRRPSRDVGPLLRPPWFLHRPLSSAAARHVRLSRDRARAPQRLCSNHSSSARTAPPSPSSASSTMRRWWRSSARVLSSVMHPPRLGSQGRCHGVMCDDQDVVEVHDARVLIHIDFACRGVCPGVPMHTDSAHRECVWFSSTQAGKSGWPPTQAG